MKLLIKSAKIVDPTNDLHLQTRDILVVDGIISKIESSIEDESAHKVVGNGVHVSQGWVDLHASLPDPGYEQKETISSGIAAAAAGGFTRVAVSPLSSPVRDSKAPIEYLVNSTQHKVVQLLPYGCVSANAKGNELAELYDMQQSGAVGFFDGKHSIKKPNLLARALEYVQSFDGLIINFPHTKEIAPNGIMNEGAVSTKLGLKGIPELAENLMVSRDLFLLEYTGGRLHFNTISTNKSLALIQEAKNKGLQVSCDVAAYTLLLNDSCLEGFDSRFKTMPPLRSQSDIDALIEGIKSKTIDAICSDHQPEDIESKKKELDHAAFGIINLQTAFSTAYTALHDHVDLSSIIHLFTEGPSKILGLSPAKIAVGEPANLTLFEPESSFVFKKEITKSISQNSPFYNRTLKGKVLGVVNNKQYQLNEN